MNTGPVKLHFPLNRCYISGFQWKPDTTQSR